MIEGLFKMKTITYLKKKQQIWADYKKIDLIGSQNVKGEKIYTTLLCNNLFQLISKETRKDIKNGSGNELGNGKIPGKMQALHSSSALSINVFDYWRNCNDKSVLAKSLNITSSDISSICFEKKYPIFSASNNIPPNIDIVIEYENGNCCAIECKFTEPFNKRSDNNGLKGKYLLQYDHWEGIPNIKALAEKISPEDNIFDKLNCPQLIKHILGLMECYDCKKSKFTLLYLYYDVFGEDGYQHNKEIQKFSEIVKEDGICFKAITWQELLCNMYSKLDSSMPLDCNYIAYLCKRYL